MICKVLNLPQKIVGFLSLLFFSFFTVSIGDEAIRATYEPVGLLLKFGVLLTLIMAAIGLYLLVTKKRIGTVFLVVSVIILLIGLSFFVLPIAQTLGLIKR